MTKNIPEKQRISSLRAVRRFCLHCVGGSAKLVRECESFDCPLHPFRMGKDPYRKRVQLTAEQKEERVKRLKGTIASKSRDGENDD